MPDPDTAVKPDGSVDTSAPASATDNNDTTDAVDTPSTPEVNTSPILEDSDFDDIDVAHPLKPEDIGSGEDDESSDEEANTDADADKDKAGDADKPKEGDQPAADADKPADDTTPPSAKDKRTEELIEDIKGLKADLGLEPNADIRSLVAERNALRDMQQAQIRKAGLDLERELLNMTDPDTGEAYSPDDAARIARSAVIDAEGTVAGQEAYDLGVQRNQQTMERETLKAMQDFPVFMEKLPDGTPNPEFDSDLAEMAGQHLLDAFVTESVLDADGKQVMNADGTPKEIVVNIKRSPYEIMKSVADQATRLKSQSEAEKEAAQAEAEAKAATNISKQAAGADVPTSGNTSTNRVDDAGKDFDDAFDQYDG